LIKDFIRELAPIFWVNMPKRTVRELKEWLATVPDDWEVWAYEGEVIGIVVAPPENSEISYDQRTKAEKVFET